MTSGDELNALRLENKRLARELRVNARFLDKVTKMVAAKDALENALTAANTKQKAYTDLLLENCPNIIYLLDDEGRFVLCTEMLLNLGGIHNLDLVREQKYSDVFSQYMDPDTLRRLRDATESVKSSRASVTLTEWIEFSASGGRRCYSIELMNIGGEKGGDVGIRNGVLAVFTDTTEIMREKQRSEAANNAKSDFLATMSHEIRTPMNAILGMTEMMSRSELNPLQQKYLSDIKKSSQSLLTIINDILDFSKIEAGKLEVIPLNYNLRSMLENLHSIFELMFEGKKLHLTFTIDDNMPGAVFGDENRLRQVLTNLLSNAMKYTSAGGAEFRAWLEDGLKLRFDVSDTGVGIRDEDKDKLFMPFEQLDTRKNKNIVGTGLGLAISHRLCKLMDGDLWLESEYGRGSVFSAEVPYIKSDENMPDWENEVLSEFSAPDARVLVVDDIEINLAVAGAMLGAFNIEPMVAVQGAEAIELVRNSRFDIIFMDHMMPGMDGIETTAVIRSLGGWCEDVPIVALTANAISGVEDMFMQSGFSGYLSKPLEIDNLNRCLRNLLPPGIINEK